MPGETNWTQDKRWSDQFLTEIKRILGEYLIDEPPIEEDMEHNTDLIVLRMDSVRVGCRVRRYEYFLKYQNEFTLRSNRPHGSKTELTKIIEGWGDYFFYGFSDDVGKQLIAWHLFDLKIFRLWFNRELLKRNAGQVPGIEVQNHDGSSSFRVFKIQDLPKAFVVGCKG